MIWSSQVISPITLVFVLKKKFIRLDKLFFGFCVCRCLQIVGLKMQPMVLWEDRCTLYYNVLSSIMLLQLVSLSEIEDMFQIIEKDGRIKFEVNIIPAFRFSMKGNFM